MACDSQANRYRELAEEEKARRSRDGGGGMSDWMKMVRIEGEKNRSDERG